LTEQIYLKRKEKNMTREKYESLPLATLKELAKARKMRGVSTLKKGDLIDAMLELDEQEEQKEAAEEAREEVKEEKKEETDIEQLDSGFTANGILEVLQDGYGFIRSDNYLPGDGDVYVAPSQIRRFGLKTGDILTGNTRVKTQGEKFSALLYVSTINGLRPAEAMKRKNFEDLTPIFPNQRIRLENPGCTTAMRIVDLVSPIGKGQRGMIVSPPKAGKTTLLKEVALSVQKTEPNMHLLILLIDERPEEVTDIREAIEGPNVEVIHSTFDELPEHHKRVSEMVISRAKRLVEHGKDVMILLDSITRLSRAYNLIVPPSGRTLSGGLDPAALYSPKRFFGAARNMREGGSLTILATALVDTGSKMDDVVYEEFKGTGNMELMLDRKLQEKRVFPAIDIPKSGTRREDLLLTKEEQDAVYIMRKAMNGMKSEEAVDNLLNMFSRTKTNEELVQQIIRQTLCFLWKAGAMDITQAGQIPQRLCFIREIVIKVPDIHSNTQPLIARGFRDLKIGGKCAAVQKLLNTLRRICPAYHLGRTKIARGISGCNMDTIVPVPCGKPAVIRNQAVAAVVKSFQKCRAIL
jgi:transcription termination factor Rho